MGGSSGLALSEPVGQQEPGVLNFVFLQEEHALGFYCWRLRVYGW